MMRTILVRGTNVIGNTGSEAMAIGTMRIIAESVPEARVITFSDNPALSQEVYGRYGFNLEQVRYKGGIKAAPQLLRAILWRASYNIFNVDMKWLRADRALKPMWEADLVVDIAGDGLNYYPFSLTEVSNKVFISLNILLPTLLGKLDILFPCSMGPFDNRLLAPLIRFALNKTAAIVVRDEISHKQVERLGVSKPAIYLTGDTAFLLEPATEETSQSILQRAGVDRTKPLIGINVSQLAASFSEKLRPKEGYLEIMTRLADYFVETYKATVILVPHGFPRRKMQTPSSEDDFEAVNQVYGKINNKNYIIPLRAEYSAAELKGIIGQCHMFVGARMHSLIAAISCGVPTIGISYSLKTPGLMQMVGLEEYASDIRGVTFEEIREKADKVWAGKEQIREKLTKNAENIKQGVWLNGKLVRELLNFPQEIKG